MPVRTEVVTTVTIEGGVGDDQLTGDNNANVFRSGFGDDTVFGRGGDDEIYGGPGDDYILGEDGDDYILGDSGNDGLLGGNGDDRMAGGSGNDVISGEKGDDRIAGGTGDDKLIGGEGADDFIFVQNGGHDTVFDYTPGEDRIVIQVPADFDGSLINREALEEASVHDGRDLIVTFGDNNSVTILDTTFEEVDFGLL